jgi:hypothetical protein
MVVRKSLIILKQKKVLDIQRGRVGGIIETPVLYPGMTAKNNLNFVYRKKDRNSFDTVRE